MTVSSVTSVNPVQSAGLTAALTQAGFAGGQALGGDDPAGSASTAAPSLASLQSPSQLFSADSLSALISAQVQQSSDPLDSQNSSAQTSSGQTHRHHHHHGVSQPTSSSTDTGSDASASGSDAIALPAAGSPAAAAAA